MFGFLRHSPKAEETFVYLPDTAPLHFFIHGNEDRYISTSIRRHGTWDYEQTMLVLRYLQPGQCFIDIGANIGWYTLIAAEKVGRAGHVYAFEPEADNFRILSKNIAANGFKQVRAFAYALGQRAEGGRLFLSPTNLGDHRVASAMPKRASQRIKIRPLDSIEEIKNQAVHMMKIDTQGSELEVLRGAAGVIAANHANLILQIEYWPQGLVDKDAQPSELLDFFQHQGFVPLLAPGVKDPYLHCLTYEHLRQLSETTLAPATGHAYDLLMIHPSHAAYAAITAEARSL